MKILAILCWLACLANAVLANAQSVSPQRIDDLPRHGIIGLVVVSADPAQPANPQTNPLIVKTAVPGRGFPLIRGTPKISASLAKHTGRTGAKPRYFVSPGLNCGL